MFQKVKLFINQREIYRIHTAQAVRAMALSIVSIYIPVYLFTLGYSLSHVIIFYIIFHSVGLLFTLIVISPLVEKFGLIRTLKLYYPVEILFYILVYFANTGFVSIWLIASIGGIATFTYYVPLNILLIKHADENKMGSDMATFFALPKIFKLVGPLIGAILVPTVGFWSVFLLAMIGLIISFIPLIKIKRSSVKTAPKLHEAWRGILKRKKLFILEAFDNIIEESEWFWGIYIFLTIGSLSAPGIASSLFALGGILFMLVIGKKANNKAKKLIIIASIAIILVSISKVFIISPILMYSITVVASFVMTLFLVPYFSVIYRAVKNDYEEEFIILREIPTVFGRLIVFGVILVLVNNPNYVFILPAIVGFILLIIFVRDLKKGGI